MKKIATKTWKIGEVCRGGIITVEIKESKEEGKLIEVIGKEWDFSTGSRRSSDQTNAKAFMSNTHGANETDTYWRLRENLEYLATSYWSDTIIKWIETKVKIGK